MDNPFKIPTEKLQTLLAGYKSWKNLNPKDEIYAETYQKKLEAIKRNFLNVDLLAKMTDEEFFDKIRNYTNQFDGQVFRNASEKILKAQLNNIRSNLIYILTSSETPFSVAQEILGGSRKILKMHTAFWSPLLQARFPQDLPNWNSKTEEFLGKFGINITQRGVSYADKYKVISAAFKTLAGLDSGLDFHNINHLMHYGTEIAEGKKLVDDIIGTKTSGSAPVLKNSNSDDSIAEPESAMQVNSLRLLDFPLNSILYGPPGTGKTFHSISHAMAIVENKTVDAILSESSDQHGRAQLKARFDQYIVEAQIVFCTFHQSMSYEDFIEGIKPMAPTSEDPQLTYAVQDGIFKRLSVEACFSYVQQSATAETEQVMDFSLEYDRFVDLVNERLSRGEVIELVTRSGGNIYVDSISQKNNIWVSHLKGTRKYTVSKSRLTEIAQAFPVLEDVTNINDQFRAEIGGSNSSAYWAVLNAIRKLPASNSKVPAARAKKEYSYDDKRRIIKSLKMQDYKNENPNKFVLIIDEINRGNLSQIFGELITLIEEDKRLGKDEALTATLPYSKDAEDAKDANFGVPSNLYIIGTMNTADRSVEALDTALRRRFSFVSMAPKPENLKITAEGINLPDILRVLNKRLAVLKDADHTIGHAWLWNVKDFAGLKVVFRDKILPLLQEYFYNDYEKLGLVLGDAFFKTPHLQVRSNIFASFSGGDGLAGQYDQTWKYELKSIEDLTVEDFRSLERRINQEESHEV